MIAMQVIEINGNTYRLDIDDDKVYETLKSVIGGWLEAVTLPDCVMFIDEEGKLKGKDPNHVATIIAEGHIRPDDYISGVAVLLGDVDEFGDNMSVPQTVIDRVHSIVHRSDT